MTTPVVRGRPSRKRPADFTGRQTEELNEQHKVEKTEAAARIAMVTADKEESLDVAIDYTKANEPVAVAVPQAVTVNTPTRAIRVNTDIDQMTYGREVIDAGDASASPPRPAVLGPLAMYTFKEGQLYNVPAEVAEHLAGKGYLSYMGGA